METNPALPGTERRWPVLGALCLIAGPVLVALALATLPDLWNGDLPDYTVINADHDLALLSFNLAAAAFPFLFGSALVLADAARGARGLATAGLICSFAGLSAMFANMILSVPLVLMEGITDHAGLDQLSARLADPPLIPLFLFPLYLIGSLLQGIALWRSHAVPGWAAAAVMIGGLFPLAVITGIGLLALPITALRIAGSIPLIRRCPLTDDDHRPAPTPTGTDPRGETPLPLQ